MGYYTLLAKLLAARDRAYEVPGRLFDVRHGVETSNMIPAKDLQMPEEFRRHAVRYQPTKIAVFGEVLRRLPIDDRQRFAFVDFGCGKGRCLLLAADAGFGLVTGVELSRPLCDAAKRNASLFRSGCFAGMIDVQCCDAAAARLPSAPSVYFFYNPFSESVMAAAVRNIEAHLDRAGVEAFIAYVNPVHRLPVEAGGFQLVARGRRRSEDWAIWHRPAV